MTIRDADVVDVSVCDVCSEWHCFDFPDPCLGEIVGAHFACCGHGEGSGMAYLDVDLGSGVDPEKPYGEWIASLRRAGLIAEGDEIRGTSGWSHYWQRPLLTFYLVKSTDEQGTIGRLKTFTRELRAS